MGFRKWNLIVVSAFGIGGLLVAAFNYFIDPYEVFGQTWLRNGYAANERYRKVEHLLTARHPHDSYIIGSSVMGVFNPIVANRITGRDYYNLSFLAGTPKDAYDALRALKKHGLPIREVLFGVDFFTFYEHQKGLEPSFRPHPSVTGELRAQFFASYLFSPGLWQGLNRVFHHLQAEPSIHFDIEGAGIFRLHEYDRRIAADHGKYVSEMFPPNHWNDADVIWVDARFDEFESFCRWLNANEINARVFVHPFHGATLDTVSQKSYAEFMLRLRKIRPDIVDFSGVSKITRESRWYYDKRHYRPMVADRIMEIVMNDYTNPSKLEDMSGY